MTDGFRNNYNNSLVNTLFVLFTCLFSRTKIIKRKGAKSSTPYVRYRIDGERKKEWRTNKTPILEEIFKGSVEVIENTEFKIEVKDAT